MPIESGTAPNCQRPSFTCPHARGRPSGTHARGRNLRRHRRPRVVWLASTPRGVPEVGRGTPSRAPTRAPATTSRCFVPTPDTRHLPPAQQPYMTYHFVLTCHFMCFMLTFHFMLRAVGGRYVFFVVGVGGDGGQRSSRFFSALRLTKISSTNDARSAPFVPRPRPPSNAFFQIKKKRHANPHPTHQVPTQTKH